MMADAQNLQPSCPRMFRFLIAICLILVGLTMGAAAQGGKRLFLKDGTWQGITKYEVQRDRARYFSSQRGEWEELPTELVDWNATEAWNAGSKEISPELDLESEAERKAEVAEKAMAAPGLRLPNNGGVFILDMFSGQLSLNELAQNGSELNNDSGSAINRKASFMQRFELKGSHARVQAHVTLPEIFVNINQDSHAQQIALTDRFRILRLEPKRDSRVLVSVKVSVLGNQSQSQQFLPTSIEKISGGWLKIIMLGALEPGEYALVEMLGKHECNSYAWDFGVDPNATTNPRSRKPDSPENDQKGTISP